MRTSWRSVGSRRCAGLTLLEVLLFLGILVLVATLAVPNYLRERRTVQRNVCIEQLRQIAAAKEAWVNEVPGRSERTPSESDLAPHLRRGAFPSCPAGGEYAINGMGQAPTCSLAERLGHVLPEN